MPYIPEDQRKFIRAGNYPVSAGELNYAITHLLEQYRAKHGDSYRIYNEMIGALECAKQEFYRKVMVPYEDKKCKVNGDVYATPTKS